MVLRGVTKSICCESKYTWKDCSINIGTKSHKGRTIKKINKMHMIPEEIFFSFIILKSRSYAGAKITANIIPITKDIRIGFNKKKERMIRVANIIEDTTFLKKSSSIVFYCDLNL